MDDKAKSNIDKVKERLDALQESLLTEYEAVLDKLPWWQQALIWGGGVASLIGAIAACGAISGATGPAYAIAIALCIAGVLSLLASIIGGIISYLDKSGENDEIEKKNIKLEEVKSILEKMQAAN
jgi:hypothetical protein